MVPLLRHGDTLALDGRAFAVGVGDIVVYCFNGETLVHRVVAIRTRADREPVVITKGDNLPWCDPPISPGHVLARVTAAHSPRGTVPLGTRLVGVGGRCAARLSRGQAAIWSLLRRAGAPALRVLPRPAAGLCRRLARGATLAPLRLFLGAYACACRQPSIEDRPG